MDIIFNTHGFIQIISLLVLGLVAGVINTLAGGGSNLTVPLLMVFGMPPDIANATNRIGVLMQSFAGAEGFRRRGCLPLHDFKAMLLPLFLGAAAGGGAAAFAPQTLLKYFLLGAMLLVAGITLVRPDVIAPPPGTVTRKVADVPSSRWLLLLTGFYGGFIQAGVGFPLIAVFAGSLRYDLVRSNALKALAVLFFTAVALLIFIVQDQVRWIPGLILGVGSSVGALLGVKMAIRASQRSLKWFLFIMTLVASAAAILL
ncbi:MAG: sulfite exporter TauE/SafE family protein [Desulforhopalus sp.]|nr:sulfite exporter TauE/SafE family protein [Desulforhopalus sp.]